jgi:hypothetical protein
MNAYSYSYSNSIKPENQEMAFEKAYSLNYVIFLIYNAPLAKKALNKST